MKDERETAAALRVALGPPPPLKALLDAGLVEPGVGCLSVRYRGNTIVADLQADGTIFFRGRAHHAPSGFSLTAKREINPLVFSDDGWGNVRYTPPPEPGCAAAAPRNRPRPATPATPGPFVQRARAALVPDVPPPPPLLPGPAGRAWRT